MTIRIFTVFWVSVLCLVCLCGQAMGQQVSDEEMRAFEDHVRRGGFFLEEKQYVEAIAELEQAREIIDHPRVALTIARAYEQWGQCVETRRRARELGLREDLDDTARQGVAEMMGATRLCAQSGRLVVECSPEHASVRLMGAGDGACPLDAEVRAGVHTVEVSADGFETQIERVDVGVLETRQLSMTLKAGDHAVAEIGEAVPWKRYAGYGSIGVGATLITLGVISDMGASRRLEEMSGTRDPERLRALEEEASRARPRTMLLYGAGAAFAIGGGLVLYLSDTGKAEDGPGRAMYVRPGRGGFSAGMELKW